MRKFALQFHAMPSELMELVSWLSRDSHFRIFEFAGSSIAPLRPGNVAGRRLFVSGHPLASDVGTDPTGLPHVAVLDCGAWDAGGLGQSSFMGFGRTSGEISDWTNISRKIRKCTTAGMTAINPRSGARARIKSFRFTAGVREFHLNGGVLLPPAGDAVLLPD
jgi:hypothetical protein